MKIKKAFLISVLSMLFVRPVTPVEITYQGPEQERFERGFSKTFFQAPVFLLVGGVLFALSDKSFQYHATNDVHRIFSFTTLGGSLYCFFESFYRGVMGAGLMYGYDVEKPPAPLKKVRKKQDEAPESLKGGSKKDQKEMVEKPVDEPEQEDEYGDVGVKRDEPFDRLRAKPKPFDEHTKPLEKPKLPLLRRTSRTGLKTKLKTLKTKFKEWFKDVRR